MRKKKNSVYKKLVNLGRSQYVCLCKPYLRMMGVEKGDSVLVSYAGGRIEITRASKRSRRQAA